MTPSETPIQITLRVGDLASYESALDSAIMIVMMEHPYARLTALQLTNLRDKIKESIRDQQFESSINPLPFPEK